MKRECEVVEMTEALRRRTTRNVAAAGSLFTVALLFFLMSYKIGTIRIGSHYFIPVEGLATFAIAICFIYAGTVKAFVSTSDKVLHFLIGEIVKRDGEVSHLAKLSELQAKSPKRKAEQIADGKTPKAPQSPH
jgi:hypothetical protein